MANPKRSGNPAKRAASVKFEQSTGHRAAITWRDWVAAARPATLPVAIAPIALGAGIAKSLGAASIVLTVLALLLMVFAQIAVNFANDYSDGVRGSDAHRVGPQRLTASGLVAPKRVLTTALVFFALAAAAGLAAVIISERWWFLLIGAIALAAGWFYTGGKRPYGYYALGELSVFVFFGLVATVGTVWLQADFVPLEAWLGGAGVGMFAAAVLVANNLRDIETDRDAGKRTLSVLLGERLTKVLYAVLVTMPFAAVTYIGLFYPEALYLWFLMLMVAPAVLIVFTARTAKELVLVLKLTSFATAMFGVGLGFAIGF